MNPNTLSTYTARSLCRNLSKLRITQSSEEGCRRWRDCHHPRRPLPTTTTTITTTANPSTATQARFYTCQRPNEPPQTRRPAAGRSTKKGPERLRFKASIWPEIGLGSSVLTGGGLFTLGLALFQLVSGNDDETINNTSSDDEHYDRTNPGSGPDPEPEEPTGDKGELPKYRLSEVRQHGPKSESPWVTYEGKVYDITEWIPAHPGGEVILRAAGGSIEPYWNIFTIHKSQHVRDILEQYVIGHVHPDDLSGTETVIEDPFVDDPSRDPRLKQHTQKPCNAETPADGLADTFLTPNEVFYVRNHMWVPTVDSADSYDINIELPDGETKTYTIGELKKRFKLHTVTAVLQCSGNRRKDMTEQVKKTNGLQWNVGAISCAKWEGVLLRDVLADAGLAPEDKNAQHVQFSGLEAYGASIPISSALDPRGDVMLAFRMNDEPLPRDHGYPVRVIVPGHVAARSVKWVKNIVVSDEESHTTWQRKDYKCFGPNEVKQDWDKYKSIQKMPITSAITRYRLMGAAAQDQKNPDSPATAPFQRVQMEGYAYSGGGHEIQRVDVSLDGGKTWDQARLLQDDASQEQGHQAWCWKRWRYEGPLPEALKDGARTTTFVVKATDDAYNTQPETQSSIYNLRGNLATAWHRVGLSMAEK